MRAGKSVVIGIAVTAVVSAGHKVSAHRLDECLQAARIAVEPGHVELELDLTPGIAVAESIISDIDRDRDGSMSVDEQQAYVGRVLAALDLESDGQPLDVTPGPVSFDDVDALRRGVGMIRVRAAAHLPNQSGGTHRVHFGNRYRSDISVYLANALVPESDRVAVTAQQHEAEQRELTIDYVVRGEQRMAMPAWIVAIITAISALALTLRPAKSEAAG